MRCVIQRVNHAKVKVDGNTVGEIEKGLLVLVGIKENDDSKVQEYIYNKIVNLRVFEDENGQNNKSLTDIAGDLLIVSNFTLYGDIRTGRRPSYINSAKPDVAKIIYDEFCQLCKEYKSGNVAFGTFQAHMDIDVECDGPVTVLLDSDKNF